MAQSLMAEFDVSLVPNKIPGWWTPDCCDTASLAQNWAATVNKKIDDITALTVLRAIANVFLHQSATCEEKLTSAIVQQIWAFAAPLTCTSGQNRVRSTGIALLCAITIFSKNRKGAELQTLQFERKLMGLIVDRIKKDLHWQPKVVSTYAIHAMLITPSGLSPVTTEVADLATRSLLMVLTQPIMAATIAKPSAMACFRHLTKTHPDCLHRVVKADIATLRASSTSSVDIDGLSSEQLLLAARDGLLPASMVEYHLPDMIACLRHAKDDRHGLARGIGSHQQLDSLIGQMKIALQRLPLGKAHPEGEEMDPGVATASNTLQALSRMFEGAVARYLGTATSRRAVATPASDVATPSPDVTTPVRTVDDPTVCKLFAMTGIDTISNNSSNFSELADTPGVSKGSASNVVSDTISLIQEIFCLSRPASSDTSFNLYRIFSSILPTTPILLSLPHSTTIATTTTAAQHQEQEHHAPRTPTLHPPPTVKVLDRIAAIGRQILDQKIYHSNNIESKPIDPGMELFLRTTPGIEPLVDSLLRICVVSLDVIKLPLRPHAPQRSCAGWTGRGGCVDIVTCLTVASLYLVPAMLAKSSLETSRSTQTVIKGFCMKCARASSDDVRIQSADVDTVDVPMSLLFGRYFAAVVRRLFPMDKTPPGVSSGNFTRILPNEDSIDDDHREVQLHPEQLQLWSMLSSISARQLMVTVSEEEDRYHKYTQRVRQFPHKKSPSKQTDDDKGSVTSLLSQLLKHSLPMLDCMHEPVQRAGVSAVHAIVQGVTPTQLRWYGEVVLDVLTKAQQSVNPRVRQTLDPLLVQCVRMIEHPPDTGPSQYELFLTQALEPLLRSMSLLAVAHLPALFDTLFRDCQVVASCRNIVSWDPSTPYVVVAACLRTLARVCKFCWPRTPAHQKKLCLLSVRCYLKPALQIESASLPKPILRVQQASIELLKVLVVCSRLVSPESPSLVLESVAEAAQRQPLLRPLYAQLQTDTSH